MSGNNTGHLLEELGVDDTARFVAELWSNYSMSRRRALDLGNEARQYVMATDINSTSATVLPHKNRTHMPKLTEISDRLQFHYWKAALGRPDFFRFVAEGEENKRKARNLTALIRTKLEQQKFRSTVGRELVADYTVYGNCFAGVSYVNDMIGTRLVYQGPKIYRRSPLDISMDPQATSFSRATKIERELVHIGDLLNFPEQYRNVEWNEQAFSKIREIRSPGVLDDYIDTLKSQNIRFDGYDDLGGYFRQDMIEVLIYRGDVYNRVTGDIDRNRVVMVADRMFVLRNEFSPSPSGFDGIHHAGWRIRPDNLWGMGPLDNLVGLQYRIDHLENLKADVFDLIVQPPLKIKGTEVMEPDAYRPGAIYYLGSEDGADVQLMSPNVAALQADNEIQYYSQLMEQFAGAPPQKSGIRTPGEKTAFEVDLLEANSTEMFIDKVKIFESMLENVLQEVLEIVLLNFNGTEYIRLFNDTTGGEELIALRREDVQDLRGKFVATGSYYWEKNRRKAQELANFYSTGAANDPKLRYHMNGEKLAKYWEERMELYGEGIFDPFSGVKEDVLAQAVAASKQQELAAGQSQNTRQSTNNNQTVQPRPGGTQPDPQGT